MLKNMKLGTKLLLAFMSVATITLILGIVGYYSAVISEKTAYGLGEIRLVSIEHLLFMNKAQTVIDSSEKTLMNRDVDSAVRNQMYERIAHAWNIIDDSWKKYESVPRTAEEERNWRELVSLWNAWKRDHETFLSLSKDYDRAVSSNQNIDETYAKLQHQGLQVNAASWAAVDELFGRMVGLNEQTAIKEAAYARTQGAFLKVLSLVSAIVGVALAVCLGIIITRSIKKVLTRIVEALSEGSEQVAAASGQVSAASQSLAEGATEQAAGLQETSSSLEEMSSMTKQNADNAQQANTLAAEAKKAAGTGSEAMSRMSQAIQEIQKSSDETSKIIKVIDEIAFQTNLLALNAAVEAARAGEAGKGFAVVAEEVRNLAMRSAEAAKNTASMIEESVKNAKNGVDIANEVSKVLEEIVQSVGKTTDLVSEIAAASQEQAQGIDQVNTAVSQMDKVTQQNAANAEESASASEELSAQAESMKEIVGQLVAIVGGRGSQSRSEGAGPARPSDHGNIESRLHAVSSSRSKPRKSFGKSDEVLHKIASPSGKNRSQTTSLSAKSAIPLEGDQDSLKEFNS